MLIISLQLGATNSNHCRTTTLAAASVGVKTILFLWGNEDDKYGNLYLSKIAGADCRFINEGEFNDSEFLMNIEKQKREENGSNVMIIPLGGSSPLGLWGYVQFVKELKLQSNKKINAITLAGGSGGTAAGILIGSALFNFPLNIYIVNVLMNSDELLKSIQQMIERFINVYMINIKIDYSKLIIIDKYTSEGYKEINEDKIKLIKSFASETGIILDLTYTGKAFYAYFKEFIEKDVADGNVFSSYWRIIWNI